MNSEMKSDWKKNTILFLASQTVSLFGTSLVQYAIMWSITLRTQSGAMITLSIIAGFLPTFLLSPFSGVWADRYPRKAIIALADSMIAVATLVLAGLFALGYDAIWLLLMMSSVRALGSGVQNPAVHAFLPQLVPDDKLMKVTATSGSIQSMVSIVSPMAAGALLTVAPIQSIFLIDAVTAAIAVIILLGFLKVPAHAKAASAQSTSYLSDLRDGIRYIRNHAYLMTFSLLNVAFCLLVAPVAFLTPLQVTRNYGEAVWRLTAIEVTFSGGMMLGGLVMASWGGLPNKVHSMVLANFIIGAFTAALGFVTPFWIYCGFMVLIGMAFPLFNAPSNVLLQQQVEDSYRGRVFGVQGMIWSSMMPLGSLVFGPLADVIRIEWLLIGTGLLMCVQSMVMLSSKVMVEAGRPVVPQPTNSSV
ncbi:MAG: MFS transporter [Bacillota bacterium]